MYQIKHIDIPNDVQIVNHTNTVKQVNSRILTNKKYKRAGVILYSLKPTGENVYIFGVDRKSNEITDFGGRVEPKDNTVAKAALRECSEETLRIIKLKNTDIRNDTIYFGYRMAFIFHYIDWNFFKHLRKEFSQRVKKQPNSENTEIVYFSRQEVVDLTRGYQIKTRYMYPKIRRELFENFEEIDMKIFSM